jgi:hypothetical protein
MSMVGTEAGTYLSQSRAQIENSEKAGLEAEVLVFRSIVLLLHQSYRSVSTRAYSIPSLITVQPHSSSPQVRADHGAIICPLSRARPLFRARPLATPTLLSRDIVSFSANR